VDTGIDYTHPDLAANIWSAPASFTVNIGGKTITCAAGTHGFNAILKTCDPMDDNGHGTHVSGTIGAVGNNALGVVGVNWTTQIMGAKFLAANGSGTNADAINAMEFVIQAKAAFAATGTPVNVRVLSNSWGGSGFSQALLNEINSANANDMLFVVAAGNSAANNDTTPTYPANFQAPNVISVAANDQPDALAYFSNYGATTVHLSAPGVNVLSTWPGATYQVESGTSMATPHVSGAALLVLSKCPMNTASLKQTLLTNIFPLASLSGLTITGGRLSVDNAIRACTGSPSAYGVTAGQTMAAPGGAITVSWSVPAGTAANDWVGLFQSGTPNTAYLWYQFTNGAPTGTITLTLPTQTGQYEFRYLIENGYVSEAKSGAFMVSSSVVVPPAVSAVQATNITSSGATITWTTSTAADTQVEYGLTTSYGSVTTLDPNKVTSHTVTLSNLTQSTTYHYRVRSSDASGILSVSGDFSFTTPPSSAGFSLSATPASVNLGGSITITWTAPSGRPASDWIGLYAVGAPNTTYIWYQFTGGATSGTATAAAPSSQAGQYEFRYLLQNGYTDIVRSNTVTVTAAGFTLNAAPTTTSPGGTVTASWTAPSGRPTNDWVGLFQVGASNTTYLWYQYTGGATSGSVNAVMPSQTGQYEFRYLLQNGYTDVVRSSAISVTATAVVPVISAVQSSNVTASGATITWTTNVATDSQVEYGPTSSYGSVTNVDTNLVTSHSETVAGLAASTLYHFRVKSKDASANLAVSGDYTFTTAASSAGYTLTATPSSVSLGGTLTVSWTAPSGRPANDWVALYQVGAPNTTYLWYQYTNGAVSGSFSVTAPSQAGQYEFRYLLQNGYTDVARSSAVSVTSGGYTLTAAPTELNPGGALTVSWTAPAGRPTNDWIGLFQVGAANNAYVWYQYTGGAASGTFHLTAPSPLGQYEFHYLLQNTYNLATTSNQVAIDLAGTYTLTATPSTVSPGGGLSVNWSAPSGRPTNDWIGLFQVGAPNTSYVWYSFTGGATSGSFNLPAPAQAGTYEFRYLLQNGYTSIATSGAVTDQ
jgi:subtilisin family serine protease